jgi:hypothetical protein
MSKNRHVDMWRLSHHFLVVVRFNRHQFVLVLNLLLDYDVDKCLFVFLFCLCCVNCCLLLWMPWLSVF